MCVRNGTFSWNVFSTTTNCLPLRRYLADIHVSRERAIVNDDVSQVRVAVLLVLLADIDVAGRAVCIISAFLDVLTGRDQSLEVLGPEFAIEERRDVKNQKQAGRDDQSRPEQQARP